MVVSTASPCDSKRELEPYSPYPEHGSNLERILLAIDKKKKKIPLAIVVFLCPIIHKLVLSHYSLTRIGSQDSIFRLIWNAESLRRQLLWFGDYCWEDYRLRTIFKKEMLC